MFNQKSEDEVDGPDTGEIETSSADTNDNIRTFASLRIRNFRFLLSGTVLSNAVMWIQQVTLSWLVYDITGSGTTLGSINLVRSIASLGMIPLAGILIDRSNRRTLMLLSNGWLFIITLVLGLVLVLERSDISHLFIFSFLGGLTQAVDMNLRQVVVFDLVPRVYAPNALALIQTGWSLMRSFGPGIGSILILWIGAGGNFLAQAGICVLIIITIMQIQFPSKKSGMIHRSPIQNIKESIQYVLKEKVTRTFMMTGFILPVFIIPIFSILPPIYAVEVFGDESGKVLGFLMASIGFGGIFGGIVTASLGRFERRGLLQLAALFLLSLVLIGLAFSKVLWVALLSMALAGFFEVIFLTTNQTLLQLSIPDELRGRVTSVINLNAALVPLGGLMAGGGSDLLGGPEKITAIMCCIAAGIAICVLLFSPTVRNYRLSQTIKTDPLIKPVRPELI